MSSVPTYFDALITFVLNRSAGAERSNDVDRESTALALRTYLNTISHGLPDPLCQIQGKGKSVSLEEVIDLEPSSLHYSENNGRKPARKPRTPSLSSVLIFKAHPCPECRPPSSCPNSNIITLSHPDAGPFANLATSAHAIDLTVRTWVTSIFPHDFSWTSPLSKTIPPTQQATLFSLITLSYHTWSLRRSMHNLGKHLKCITSAMVAFSTSLSFLLGVLVDIAESHGSVFPSDLPFSFTPADGTSYLFPGTRSRNTRLQPPRDHYLDLLSKLDHLLTTLSNLDSFLSSTLPNSISLALMSCGSLATAAKSSPHLPQSSLCQARLEQVGEMLAKMDLALSTDVKVYVKRFQSLAQAVKVKQLQGWDFSNDRLTQSNVRYYAKSLIQVFGDVQKQTFGKKGWMAELHEENDRLKKGVVKGYLKLRTEDR
ncbi:hypothetical protein QBC40DRAFT_164443 [Triangularia verruculosa]|uniref:Uncharacterized protein n=1 Tax=Triangularia verruculosa TaxID=2587418 RepID=A0AAN6XVQ0_9PEZI|nr:hypothetical protein QBC40DRAFT_164443 [Triangularia verruculosa]